MIDLFDMDIDGPIDRLATYLLATYLGINYRPDTDLSVSIDRDTIALLLGGVLENVPDQEPRVDLIRVGSRTVVLVRGTTTLFQMYREWLNSDLGFAEPWPGGAGDYYVILTRQIWDKIANLLPGEWVIAGDSLGGAIAAMLTIRGAQYAVTFGAPPQGESFYARGMEANRKHLRFVNHGDFVPYLSHSTTANLNLPGPPGLLGMLPSTFFSYTHWGRSVRIFEDGSFTQPPQDVYPYQNLAELVVAWGRSGYIVGEHYASEYARRIRGGIPVQFPLSAPDPEWFGLYELDQINLGNNAATGREWEVNPEIDTTNIQLGRQFARYTQSIGPRESVDDPQFRCG